MRRRKEKKPRHGRPVKLTPEMREYLAHIGAFGGQASRRYLSKSHARQMVAIREAKKRAFKEGRLEYALTRIQLPKEKPMPVYHRPAVRPRRLVGTFGPDS